MSIRTGLIAVLLIAGSTTIPMDGQIYENNHITGATKFMKLFYDS